MTKMTKLKLKKDIDMVVRLRVARELLLKEWDKRFARATAR